MGDSRTVDAYDKFARQYDEGIVEFWENFPKDFLRAFAQAAPGKRVLNVGSGSGRDALLLRNYGFTVVCQDGSKRMVAMTKRLGFESVVADFSAIDFPAASFDAVWAFTSLIHIPKAEASEVITRLRTLLKPEGVFAIGVMEGDTAGMAVKKFMPGVERYFKYYSQQELQDLIEPIGFALVYSNEYQPNNRTFINHLYRKKTV